MTKDFPADWAQRLLADAEDPNGLDMLAYQVMGNGDGNRCLKQGPATNFLGGRKGSKLIKAIRDAQVARLTDHKDPAVTERDDWLKVADTAEYEIACFGKGKPCHISWGALVNKLVQQEYASLSAEYRKDHVVCLESDQALARVNSKDFVEPTAAGAVGPSLAYHLWSSLDHRYHDWGCTELFDEQSVLSKLLSYSFTNKADGIFTEFKAGGPVASSFSQKLQWLEGKVFGPVASSFSQKL